MTSYLPALNSTLDEENPMILPKREKGIIIK